MPCVAQFGIIDEFEKNKDYSDYEPEKYHLVAIDDDDFIDDWWNNLTKINTYFHSYNRPASALARYGVTLIPPESLEPFCNIVSTDNRFKSSKELIDLLTLRRKAISENKYVIHYGI
ncbi:hypothetical protein [Desulfosporosinus sp. OT]|uniref:hypothetical protein n=1 Tax=Desulfosporosinus sp. OT TaxID=913865 RepID=UPI00058B5582|nr:hypothetical protein [Desulfosporosinus sp. OT]